MTLLDFEVADASAEAWGAVLGGSPGSRSLAVHLAPGGVEGPVCSGTEVTSCHHSGLTCLWQNLYPNHRSDQRGCLLVASLAGVGVTTMPAPRDSLKDRLGWEGPCYLWGCPWVLLYTSLG